MTNRLIVTLSRSNNNNRNRAETAAALEQINPTSTSTSSAVVGDDSAGGSQLDASGRLRSMFPTTEDTRRRQYWSQISGDKCAEESGSNTAVEDGITGGGGGGVQGEGVVMNGGDLVRPPVRDIEIQSIAQTGTTDPQSTPVPSTSTPISTPSISDIIPEMVPASIPSKADMLNEFNWVSPATLTEAERYEERIKQLESVPLPCIDAVTGMVHIVGESQCPHTSYLVFIQHHDYDHLDNVGNTVFVLISCICGESLM